MDSMDPAPNKGDDGESLAFLPLALALDPTDFRRPGIVQSNDTTVDGLRVHESDKELTKGYAPCL